MASTRSVSVGPAEVSLTFNSSDTVVDQPSNSSQNNIATEIYPVVFIYIDLGIIIMGLLGNALVIMVVTFDKRMRTVMNVFILMLAVTDFCFLFTSLLWGWVTNMCGPNFIFCEYSRNVTMLISIYTLVLMSVVRYLAVVHPVRSIKVRSTRNAWLAIGVVWLTVNVMFLPIFLNKGIPKLYVRLFMIVICWFLPMCIVTVLYVLIYRRLKSAVPGGQTHESRERLRAKRRATRMVAVVVVVYFLCWLSPIVLFINIFICSFTGECKQLNHPVLKFVFFLANPSILLNSAVNPILYAFLSANFRWSFARIIRCKFSS